MRLILSTVLVGLLLAGCGGSAATATPIPHFATERASPTFDGRAADAVYAAIKNVCNGTPYPSAPPYSGDVHPMSAVGLSLGARRETDLMALPSSANDALAEVQLMGADLRLVQLVACEDDSWNEAHRAFCSYVGGLTLEIDQRVKKVSVLIVSTGRVLDSKIFMSRIPGPSDCPFEAVNGSTGYDPPVTEDVGAYLLRFVHGSPLPYAAPTH